MNIENIIQGIVGTMGIGYLYETVYGANIELDKIVRDKQRNIANEVDLPAAVNILATSGSFDFNDGQYHNEIREMQNIRILFLDQMKHDDKLDQDDVTLIERLKEYARDFIKRMAKSGKFFNIERYNWQIRLNAFDANVGVFELTATVKEFVGTCVDE